jgi:hypothetical protein
MPPGAFTRDTVSVVLWTRGISERAVAAQHRCPSSHVAGRDIGQTSQLALFDFKLTGVEAGEAVRGSGVIAPICGYGRVFASPITSG